MQKQIQQYQNKYGYYHGRFQPFHNGHLKMIKKMLEKHQEIIIAISNPFRAAPVFDEKDSQEFRASVLNQARAKENNPWTFWQRMLMIRQSLKDEKIDLNRVIIIPNMGLSGFNVDEVRFPKEQCVLWILPGQAHNKINLEIYLKEGWQVEVVDIKEKVISGTMIRNLIKENNSEWEKYVPKGTAEIIKQYPMN